MKLRDLAHSRTGDKGDLSCISLTVYDLADYEKVKAHVTADRVAEFYAPLIQGTVTRYELPQLGALNFILTRALGGGVTRSLALDSHGKCLGSALLDMEI
ncbi:MAG: AtuA-related protein [Saccharofermentanales bacterium]|jgi:hypothetical protein|nr:hypothetical protein [Clostridiaceae bacterium]